MTKQITIPAGQKRKMAILWTGEETELTYTINLAGAGAEMTMLMLLLGNEAKTVVVNTEIYHQKPQTKSRLVVKGVLTDKARVDFNGLVKIEHGAKGADAWLAAHLLLLSDKAAGRAVPNLEIAENDVKAGHAATVGRVNDQEIFYLMTRGLSHETATNLIVRGFLESMIKEFPDEYKKRLPDFYKLT